MNKHERKKDEKERNNEEKRKKKGNLGRGDATEGGVLFERRGKVAGGVEKGQPRCHARTGKEKKRWVS